MLILTRRVGERLTIGDQIAVTILSVSGKQVRLGIDAPKDVAIAREEVSARTSQSSDTTPSKSSKG